MSQKPDVLEKEVKTCLNRRQKYVGGYLKPLLLTGVISRQYRRQPEDGSIG